MLNQVKLSSLQLKTPHISICDGNTFGLDGGLTGDAAPPFLQGQLPVWELKSVGADGPRGTRPKAIWWGHAIGSHVHGCHQVGQLTVVLLVQLRPADSVCAHCGVFPVSSQLNVQAREKQQSMHLCTEKQKQTDMSSVTTC